MAGKVVAVCTSETRGVPKRNVGKAYFEEGSGVVGDAHAGPWHRQVSLLALESIARRRAKGFQVEDAVEVLPDV